MNLQAELKTFEVKALVSLDKGIKLVFYSMIPEESSIDINELQELLHKPLLLTIKEHTLKY